MRTILTFFIIFPHLVQTPVWAVSQAPQEFSLTFRKIIPRGLDPRYELKIEPKVQSGITSSNRLDYSLNWEFDCSNLPFHIQSLNQRLGISPWIVGLDEGGQNLLFQCRSSNTSTESSVSLFQMGISVAHGLPTALFLNGFAPWLHLNLNAVCPVHLSESEHTAVLH